MFILVQILGQECHCRAGRLPGSEQGLPHDSRDSRTVTGQLRRLNVVLVQKLLLLKCIFMCISEITSSNSKPTISEILLRTNKLLQPRGSDDGKIWKKPRGRRKFVLVNVDHLFNPPCPRERPFTMLSLRRTRSSKSFRNTAPGPPEAMYQSRSHRD